jgi:Lsr2
MAQKVQVILVDDIDGGPAEETLSFSLDGVSYEIDLSSANAAKLRDNFAPYVGTARRVGGRSSAGRGRSRRGSGDNRAAQIREWARGNGHQVNERGRVSATIVAAYEAAHAARA